MRGTGAEGPVAWHVRVGVSLVLVLLALGTTVTGSTSGAAVASLLVVGLTGRSNLTGLLGWIGGGAVVLGAVFWGLGQVLSAGLAPELLLGFGIAIGGGLGGVIRLLGFGEREPETDETLTFDRGAGGDAGSTPDPRPADLFEEHPDPILYFDDSGDGPVVRAVNPAFESVFGVTTTAVEGAALTDASMASERVADLVAAAEAGEAFGEPVTCETAGGEGRFRVTVATRSEEVGLRGYLTYTPVAE